MASTHGARHLRLASRRRGFAPCLDRSFPRRQPPPPVDSPRGDPRDDRRTHDWNRRSHDRTPGLRSAGSGCDCRPAGHRVACTPEAGTSAPHRQALRDARYPHMILTRAYSGRFARGWQTGSRASTTGRPRRHTRRYTTSPARFAPPPRSSAASPQMPDKPTLDPQDPPHRSRIVVGTDASSDESGHRSPRCRPSWSASRVDTRS